MNNQEQSTVQRKLPLPTEVTPIYIKPRPRPVTSGNDATNDHIGIYLDYDNAEVESGTGNQWTLSFVPVSAPIQGFTIFDGTTRTDDNNETNLNCLIFPGPKRIEIVTSDEFDAPPYIVFQEVISANGVTGWQIYAPVPFEIDSTERSDKTWQNAVSTEPVSIKQVRLFEQCNVSIESPPPPLPGALFQKITTNGISEVTLWR